MNKNPMTPLRSVVVVAAVLMLAACGDDAAGDQVLTPGDDTATSEATEAPAETTTTVADVEQTQAEVEAWANEVVAVHGELSANQVDNAVRWSEIFFGSDDEADNVPAAEVDAYLFLTNADADDVTTAVDQMPSSPDEPALADPYGAFLDALRAEAAGAEALAAELESDLDTLKREVTDMADSPEGGGRFNEIRRELTELQDDTTTACFDLQAVLTERGLALIDCTGE